MITFRESDHTYWLGQTKVPSVTQILSAVTDFSGIPKATLQYASERGTAVHLATELYDQDELDWSSLDDELVPYVEAWVEFRAMTGFKPILIEKRVFHPGLLYAGTLDRTGLIEGELSVVDVKTTSVLYPQVGMQLAAYAEALHAENPSAPKHTGRYAVQLGSDGKWNLKPYTDKTDWPTFVSLITMHNWCQKHGVTAHIEAGEK